MTLELDELRPRSWRRPTLAACGLTAMLVDRIGCCPCRSGGARWAINRDSEETFRRFLKRTCRRSAVCVQVNTCRDDLVPACVDGRCTARVTDG